MTLVLLAVAGSAFAYRLIVIPTAENLPDGMYKLELAAPYNSNALDAWLPTFRFDGNIYKGLEIGIKGSGSPDYWKSTGALGTLSWTIARETKATPGYGVGLANVYDTGDHADVKESFFVGMYKSVDLGLKFPVKIHVLYGTKQLNGVFGGIIIPMSKRFSGAVEYAPKGSTDTKSLWTPGTTSGFNWALGYNATPNWRLKYANCGGDNAYGIVYTGKWLTTAWK